MSASLSLFRLQQVDSQIDKTRNRLEAIRQTLENDEELQRAKTRLAQAETRHQETERTLRQAEAEVQSQHIKIEQSESMLYSGSVQNPKEVQDLQNNVASLKRHLATLEDLQLEAMLTHEEAEHALEAAQAALDIVKARLRDQNHTLAEEQAALNKDQMRLTAERQAILPALKDEARTLYDQLRQSRRGVAVALVNDGTCAACGSTLTPSQQQSVRSSTQITRCPSCGRILYAG